MKGLVKSRTVQLENQRLQQEVPPKLISITRTIPKRFIYVIESSDTEEIE